MTIEELKNKALNLPLKPGVYLMKDSNGKIIYVGKAKALKNRVVSYFRGAHNLKTEAMISQVNDFDVILATSEFEALVLENSLIKHHMPHYNILLKDDKGYPFIRLDLNKDYPAFSIVSSVAEDGAKYFGPYGGRKSTRAAIETVCKALRLPTCGKKFPAEVGKSRPCLNFHMASCDAFCSSAEMQPEFKRRMQDAAIILDGKADKLIASLKSEMECASSELRFEQAAQIRDRISAIHALKTKQHVWSVSLADTDSVAFCRGETKSCFVVLHYINGQLLDKYYELLETPIEEDSEILLNLTYQYYLHHKNVPKTVLMAGNVDDIEELQNYLCEIAQASVKVIIPQKGEKNHLAQAAYINAYEEIERHSTKEEYVTKTMTLLGNLTGLSQVPDRIEAFDVSNMGDDSIVAGMTVFKAGKPFKSEYRKFKMKTVLYQNDYASMAEAVSRRFQRYLDGDAHFNVLPDLLLIDGGEVHAATAVQVLKDLNICVPTFGMVKDDHHRTRALITPEGKEISLNGYPSVFALIGRIQEETHRFTITYQTTAHNQKAMASELEKISGVGPARRKQLIENFGSIQKIKEADLSALAVVLPNNAAEAVYLYFHQEEKE